jgi:hypothetical protein
MPHPDVRLSEASERSAAATLRFLTPDLLAVLASLYGVSRSLANTTVQLLPFGSRAALEMLDPPLAVSGPVIDAEGRRGLTLTDFAYEVIAEAKSAAEEHPDAVSEWAAQADEVARMVSYRRGR